MNVVPNVIEKTANGDRVYDLYSRLLKDRIIMLSGPIEDNMANSIIAQLLFLDAQDSDKDIYLYINSPGGIITSGMAIYDTMKFVKADVETIVMGMAASMASVLAASGTKGKRFGLPHSQVLIHQPSGGAQGQQTEIQIAAEAILDARKMMTRILAKDTGQTLKRIKQDTERDHYFTAQQAVKYGLLDGIMTNRGEKK